MFGRDPLLPLIKLLKPKIRYLGNDENILSLETLKNLYQLVVTNLKYAREKRQPKNVCGTKAERRRFGIDKRSHCLSLSA